MSSALVSPSVAINPKLPQVGRLDSIDILRGLVMVIMALDHSRVFFTHLRFEPENLRLSMSDTALLTGVAVI